MNCPKCNQATDPGAAFCGNCGQALRAAAPTPPPAVPPPLQPQLQPQPPAYAAPIPAAPASPIAQVLQNQSVTPVGAQPLNGPLTAVNTGGLAAGVPSYALSRPGQHNGESMALLALLFGIAGIVGAVFMALIGLALGIAGIVMGTMSRSSSKRGLSTAGLVVSSLAVVAGLAVIVYADKHDPAAQKASSRSASSSHNISATPVAASGLSTPCYSTGFADELNVANDSGSCDMNAFNRSTIDDSTNVYKVYADQSSGATAANFTSLVKPAIEQDVKDNLPGFSIDTERVAQFAGSPAYIVNTSNQSSDVAVVEAAVLHQVGNGQNVFILVHAVNGRSTDLNTLEAQWQWK